MTTDEPDIGDSLGDLERQVFLAIRANGRSSVAETVERLGSEGRPLAYTTVMTVMTRLWEKGYLLRRRQGKAYLYEARDDGQIAGELGGRAFREALEKYGAPALIGFVRHLSPDQRETVARLLEDETPPAADNDGRAVDDGK
ncbi:MAG: BlaI/MecI/CopY family transcriptional regulator [Thermoflexaceae bacterium]|nr:BlaI/MecI/CopY family transcriptional regulator [Thermoflexaceae bacterium]